MYVCIDSDANHELLIDGFCLTFLCPNSPKVYFWLPTMHIHHLDGSLRPGDEKSVDTSSPHSPGKK